MLRNSDLELALADATARYTAANPASLARHEAAKASLPGGNTRSVMWYEPFPVGIAKGEGVQLTDLDGHSYTDFVSEYSAGLYGHSNPLIQNAMREAIANGVALGGPNSYEALLADELCARFAALERVRFTNSGTEANIMAISAARAITGRDKVMVFREGYHGGVLLFGHGGSVLNLPFPYVMADYNDIEGTEALLRAHKDSIGAVILEQMLGAGGCIRASDAFLAMLRRVTQETGALLIFDEVMTSRQHFNGLQAVTGITPDLMTLGKYIGGGASFGAFGGRADLMARFDPGAEGCFGHGGTFNNNIISMRAGYTGLSQVLTQEASALFNALGAQLQTQIDGLFAAHGLAGCTAGYGSLFAVHFMPREAVTPQAVDQADRRVQKLWHLEMMLAGQYVTPRGMIALALPHSEADCAGLVAAMDRFLADHAAILPKLQG
ncbi:aminotransferase class III-fold pyridoxal phosphate-dependent enzyme [Xinfangfangia sp. CPCC 101601]|uniref:Aminotransferase class III-fold pyridoxal phosphate-dependent enzyme n=1 Tax=Pseudogemmobacter lacusdianii TaxID=3069608 RepID=A0ABU0VVY0_9RHOB|nr:aminotransferase class III-fold pyridoxal phosphate-dependent enzyme [Xinfangfangia sp. CPCC 101601]MDQ2065899.1 aminotransferase class III-fold pyridoxal phosphate-dependent enzyme [Xinfangfangia sp. CPCC 101601]